MTPDQAASIATSLYALQFAMLLGILVLLPILRDLLQFALARWPAYRLWKRTMRRMDRLEFLSELRERRQFVAYVPSPSRLCPGCASESAATCVCRGAW